eukprot:scaffold46089_cov24-Tisochrysis_lutea.AAC.1
MLLRNHLQQACKRGSKFATSGVVPFLPSASMSSQQSSKRIIRGIVYDMDGTVVVPVIDFNEMRRRCGVVQGDILDVINSRSKEEQDRAYAIIAEIEEQPCFYVHPLQLWGNVHIRMSGVILRAKHNVYAHADSPAADEADARRPGAAAAHQQHSPGSHHPQRHVLRAPLPQPPSDTCRRAAIHTRY